MLRRIGSTCATFECSDLKRVRWSWWGDLIFAWFGPDFGGDGKGGVVCICVGVDHRVCDLFVGVV